LNITESFLANSGHRPESLEILAELWPDGAWGFPNHLARCVSSQRRFRNPSARTPNNCQERTLGHPRPRNANWRMATPSLNNFWKAQI